MKFELLALLDLIEALLNSENMQQVHSDQIQSQLKKFNDVKLVGEIIKEIEECNYKNVLEFISGYRILCKELLPIYNSLTRDYAKLKDDHFKDEIVHILNEKYGICKIREVVSLLSQKQHSDLIGMIR